jgi:peptidoglycan-associated lipoprotein
VSFGVQEASTVTYLNSSQLAIQVSGGLPAGRYDVEVSNPDGSSAVLRGGLIVDGQAVATCESATVWFDTDKSTLNADAQGTLTNRASCYANAGATIRVEGHCDERGTTDYNLALGERRAKSVKDFLVGKGVPNDRVQTLSFGEEQPVDGSNNESAWSKNRRAEVSVSR